MQAVLYIISFSISGSYECKLCLTLHNNEGSYLAHTQGKKHQANLARRAAKEAKEAPQQLAPEKPRIEPKKFVKIGRPGYRVTKQKDPENGQQSLLFQVDYPGTISKKNSIVPYNVPVNVNSMNL